MRRVGIFMVISAAALVLLFYNSQKVDPGVNLPEVNAGEPFTRWRGVVVTCLPDGKLLLNGRPLYLANAVDELKAALKHREPKFRHLRKKLPPGYRRAQLSFVPVLLCIQKDATVDAFFNSTEILYRAGCINIFAALRKGGQMGALSLCTSAYVGRGFYFWHEEAFIPKPGIAGKPDGTAMQAWAKVNKAGSYHICCICDHNTEWDECGVKTYPHSNIEPLFHMLARRGGEGVIVGLNLTACTRDLTWGWLVETLARLDATGIEAYCFSAPD